MFKSLFVYPAVVKRHQEGPLAAERVTYLQGLVGRGVAPATLLQRARYSLAVAEALGRAPRATAPAPWSSAEVDALATAWAERQVTAGRASVPRWPHEHFHLVAVEFLGTLGWLRAPLASPRSVDLPRTFDDGVHVLVRQHRGPPVGVGPAGAGEGGYCGVHLLAHEVDVASGRVERAMAEHFGHHFDAVARPAAVFRNWHIASLSRSGKIDIMKNRDAAARGRLGGLVGGPARARALSTAERRAVATKAGRARQASLPPARRRELARAAARARWRRDPPPRTAADAPSEVRRYLKSYEFEDLLWKNRNARYEIVRVILMHDDDVARGWLNRILRRDEIRQLLKEYRGAGCTNRERAELRRTFRLSKKDIPDRPFKPIPGPWA